MTRSDPNGTRNIIIEKQSWVPSLLKLKQMGARNQSRALQETISFYAKNLSLRGLMHFLVAAIMPRLITPEPGERVTPTLGYLIPDSSLLFSFQHLAARWLSSRLIAPLFCLQLYSLIFFTFYFQPTVAWLWRSGAGSGACAPSPQSAGGQTSVIERVTRTATRAPRAAPRLCATRPRVTRPTRVYWV